MRRKSERISEVRVNYVCERHSVERGEMTALGMLRECSSRTFLGF